MATEENAFKRIMPHDSQAEQSVLGGILIDPSMITVVSEVLADGSLFYNPAYGAAYDAMLSLFKENRAIDPVTLADRMREGKAPEEVASSEFMNALLFNTPTSAHVKHYAEIVAEKATLRALIKVTEDITKDAYIGKENVNDLLENTEKKVFNIVQRRNTGEIEPVANIVVDALENIEKAAKTSGDVTGLPTGFRDLDMKTAGLHEGNLVIIAARPAMGKTSFVLSLTHHVAVRQHKCVAMFSLEMSKVELMNRLLSMDSHLDSQKFKKGDLNDGDWGTLVESGTRVSKAKLFLDDRSTTVPEMRSICRKLKIEQGLDLIVIDYLQLMTGGGRDSRQQEVSEISRNLKLMAKELGVPVIALSQLSRSLESRPDKRPMLSDLRESGAIEQDADMVMFIYRDEVYHPDKDDNKNKAELIIAKQRSGPIGTVNLTWIPSRTQFESVARM
ncbi:MAG: replicative DNA helicase [Lachnospiraceae bacterium]|nr:replicative DNA helicase [Lachnospiraceae bacterium]